jgi:hypothetical protein
MPVDAIVINGTRSHCPSFCHLKGLMSIFDQIFFVLLFILRYLVSPISLIGRWVRFALHPWPHRKVLPMLTIGSFVLATASALLAFGTIIYAQFHHFPFYDPLLMKIFGAGFLLSFAGLLLGMVGIWRTSSLRWYAPVSAIATAAFWFIATLGE